MEMNRYYDNWERLVEAVLRREQFRQLCSLDELSSPSNRSFDSQLSFSSNTDVSFRPTPSPLHPGVQTSEIVNVESKRRSLRMIPSMRKSMWKGLSIFGGFPFSSKKGVNGNEESTQAQWARPQKTFHGGREPVKSTGLFTEKDSLNDLSQLAKLALRRAEMARVRELHTLKGHIESVMIAKGLDVDSIQHNYTI